MDDSVGYSLAQGLKRKFISVYSVETDDIAANAKMALDEDHRLVELRKKIALDALSVYDIF